MRYIILVILACLLAYGVLQLNAVDPHNYVKLYLMGYSVESSVFGFMLILVLLVVVLYFLIWLYRLIWRAPKRVAHWSERRNEDKAQTQLGAGYLSLIKGDWRKAEQQLTRKSQHSKVPYLNYLAAAQAAQEQGKLSERDRYLQAAYQAAPNERLAIGLTKARLHQQAGQMDSALATLADISALGKKNPQFTAMRLQALQANEDWQAAQQLLPLARKQQALPADLLNQINDQIHLSALIDASDMDVAWRSLPREQKKLPQYIALYAKHLHAQGEDTRAEKLIRVALKNSWSDELVSLYGRLRFDKPARGLRRLEGWLLARPESAELHLAAGRLAWAAKNVDAAKEHLQAAIKLAQLPAAYALLGEVYEDSNESGKALQLYRSGIAVASQPTDIVKLMDQSEPDEELVEPEVHSSLGDARPKPA